MENGVTGRSLGDFVGCGSDTGLPETCSPQAPRCHPRHVSESSGGLCPEDRGVSMPREEDKKGCERTTKGKTQTVPRGNLESAVIEITQSCPLKCVGCYVPPDPNFMSFKDFKTIIDKTPPMESLNISGGEPLTHPDIVRILEYAKSKDISVSLFTSGYVGHHLLPTILKHLDELRVTLRLPNKLDESYRRVPKSNEQTINFLHTAKQLRWELDLELDIYIHFIVDGFTIAYCEDIRQVAADVEADVVALPYLDFTKQNTERMYEWKTWKEVVLDLEGMGFIVEMVENVCVAGVKRYAVDSFGMVRPCVYLDLSDLEKMTNKKGDKIWNQTNLITDDWDTVYNALCHWRGQIGIYRGRCPAFDNKAIGGKDD